MASSPSHEALSLADSSSKPKSASTLNFNAQVFVPSGSFASSQPKEPNNTPAVPQTRATPQPTRKKKAFDPEKAAEKPIEKPQAKPVEKSRGKAVEKSGGKSMETSVEKQPGGSVGKPAGKFVDPLEKPATKGKGKGSQPQKQHHLLAEFVELQLQHGSEAPRVPQPELEPPRRETKGEGSVGAPMRRGKERAIPKPKKPSKMRQIIDAERPDLFNLIEHLKAKAFPMAKAKRRRGNAKQSSPEEEAYSQKPQHVRLVLERSHLLLLPSQPREYCTQILAKDLDELVTSLLGDLLRFQHRLKATNPTKARYRRRLVAGLREVGKSLRRGKIKCIIVAKNVESISSAGGLNSMLSQILRLCSELEVPVVFSMSRKNLGAAILRKIPCSMVGIRDYDGANQKFKELVARAAVLEGEWQHHYCEHQNTPNDYGEPPLWVAAHYGLQASVLRLLNKGVSPDQPDHNDTTPLMAAASTGQLPVVKLLLKRGADPNLRNKFGVTALAAAYGSKHTSTVAVLEPLTVLLADQQLRLGVTLQGEDLDLGLVAELEASREEVLLKDENPGDTSSSEDDDQHDEKAELGGEDPGEEEEGEEEEEQEHEEAEESEG